ncbi:MAG: exosome protein [Nitrososphaerota archaeon]|jgi:RNA binding exosome subunit|nr:exosome protein [Nitrososphaerota archaeon]
MSKKPFIGYIDIRAFAHATEDLEKVLTAIRNLLPNDLAETVQFEKGNLTGHHGNTIVLFTTQIADKKLLPNILEKIGQNLNALDKEDLNNNLNLRIEKTNLYLRFDKQAAFMNKIKYTHNDPIHLKIHFTNKTREELLEIFKNFGLLP